MKPNNENAVKKTIVTLMYFSLVQYYKIYYYGAFAAYQSFIHSNCGPISHQTN